MIMFTVIDHAACKDNSTNSRKSAFFGEEPKCACGNYITWSLRLVYVQKNKIKTLFTRTC
jgi:hypothetical protein